MATTDGPKIIKNGLVVCIDANNRKSYPRSGSSWYDVSGNNNHFNLSNTTFNESGGGNFVFNRSNAYGVSNNNIDLSSTGAITIEYWIKFTYTGVMQYGEYSPSYSSRNAFCMDIKEFGDVGSFQFGSHTGAGYNIFYTSGGYNDDNWHCVQIVSDRSLSASEETVIYVDGVPDFTQVATTYNKDLSGNYVDNYQMFLASRNGTSNFFGGNIASFRMYKRPLLASEIISNYNFYKRRFGHS